jgi:hypothetical protein
MPKHPDDPGGFMVQRQVLLTLFFKVPARQYDQLCQCLPRNGRFPNTDEADA